MFDSIARFFKGFSPSAHAQWLGLLLIHLTVHLFTGNSDMTDRPLSYSEGRIASVGSLKGGYNLELQADDKIRKYERVFISGSRTMVVGRDAIFVGQHIRVERYGDQVGNCWIGDQQVCVSGCSSDLQCKEKQAAKDSLFLPWSVGLTVLGYLFTLTWVACGGQIWPTPKKRGENP